MDSQIIIINDKLDGYKVELNKKGEEESDMKNLKEEEERTEKENDNHMKGQTKFGQRIKTTQDTNSRVLNETMESYRAHYEDKIIEIFDEMDNLKR